MVFDVFDSVEHSGGQRVRLDLQKLNQFSIFPGQVGLSFTQEEVSSSMICICCV